MLSQAIQRLKYSERIIDHKTFEEKIEKNLGAARVLKSVMGLVPTAYFFEAMEYHKRAQVLQDRQLGLIPSWITTGDRLQDEVSIYDTVKRRFAGFSNAIESLKWGQHAPKATKNTAAGRSNAKIAGLLSREWMFVFFFHRLTGSGASFEHDHGFRNSYVRTLAENIESEGLDAALQYFEEYAQSNPVFTSIGNQIPPFPKAPVGHKQGIYYITRRAYPLICQFNQKLLEMTDKTGRPVGIQTATDLFLDLQKAAGQSRFKFVTTATVMDIAEYMSYLVDPASDCYHGKNAIEAMELCFDRPRGHLYKDQHFYDAATRFFATEFGTYPMDVEDAAPGCDLIRWVENYIPKKSYDHLDRDEIWNSNSLRHPVGRQRG